MGMFVCVCVCVCLSVCLLFLSGVIVVLNCISYLKSLGLDEIKLYQHCISLILLLHIDTFK